MYVKYNTSININCNILAWHYFLNRRSRLYKKGTLYTGEVAFSESENVVLNPVAPQPYLGTFQPVAVSEFRNHVTKMHADSDYRFSEEYGVCVQTIMI